VLFLSGLVRLWLARAGRMRGPAIFVFTILDFGLLYGLIWSFHIQYAQPPAFYLKAPTFLLVFLFISVRALRFEPWAIVTAGLTAAIGWMLMTIYVLVSPGRMITRDFVTYITSNAVLVGAEVEKVVAILLVTGVLTLAIVRGRRQLVKAAFSSTATQDLSRFFDPDVAHRITRAEQLEPGRGEMRRCAVLMADIRGFTRLAAALPPDEVMRLLVDYARRMSMVIAAHGGSIDKFLGDGILATFGCARDTETPAADALNAVLALVDEAAQFKADLAGEGRTPLDIGFGVVAGTVLFGTVGDQDRLEFTVIGEPVNLAAKLEKHNKQLGACVTIDAATLEQAVSEGFAGADSFVRRDGATVEGVAVPLDLVYRSRQHG
jgi:adenylate cyclase